MKTVVAYGLFAGFTLLVLAAELAFPRAPAIAPDARRRAMIFVVSYIPFTVVCGMTIRFPIPAVWTLGGFGFLAAPFAWDFFYYWLHRAQHAIPFLWRFHAVHHSAEELGAGTGFHHFVEEPLRLLFVYAPLTLFIPNLGLAAVFLALQGAYLHSTTRLHLGRFAWIVADNRVHRIHHSTDTRHTNKNFGAFTLIWDRLFGTAYFPGYEWPHIGVSTHPEPRTFRAYFLAPLYLRP